MDDRKFRSAMGKFATGVTVITTEVDGNVHGMTANAFMSVSLDPKLVVVSIGERAHMLAKIKISKKYAVNILSADQQELSKIFAGQIKEERDVPFDTLSGVPVLNGALAQVTCEVVGEHVEGDHTLFIGKVTNIHLEDNEPLIFFNGKYRSLLTDEVAVNN
ncbi:flavin reductase [Bacillus canaveralius]|uniref:Flavin reductase n=1 Tax=Bacillus canaveralius TaxID=1403243 RepID=A0A2N5GGS2_9BACI|nr:MULTISPECIES: flavin reductase family protein [Bacillus]PLR79932.1 flavin reductase [Bacillus canaveralius]PLR83506.1 flavin reductase [Bacillus sp. V33-4]PLR88441.1 flavin reductase [Bacillus canaveralius]RSK58169.1 flavin reductase [Bacillus canaveralius]